jgi:hypothetical protein
MDQRCGRRCNSYLQVFADSQTKQKYEARFCLIILFGDYFRELGIGIVAYSPLGRGFFSSGAKLADSLSDEDVRKVNSI